MLISSLDKQSKMNLEIKHSLLVLVVQTDYMEKLELQTFQLAVEHS